MPGGLAGPAYPRCTRPPCVDLPRDKTHVPCERRAFYPAASLMHHTGQVFSQQGADGVLHRLLSDLGAPTGGSYVEFGTQDATECNTRLLRERCGWRGLLMDGDHQNASIGLQREFLSAENILELFGKYGVPTSLDILSLDINGNEYHILDRVLRDATWRCARRAASRPALRRAPLRPALARTPAPPRLLGAASRP